MGNDGVAAVEKALALLDCFKPGAEALTLAALAQASGMHKTTVYRLMNSLERMSYVIRSESGAYSLGPRLLYLGKLYEQSFHLSSVVEPVLHALAAATRESASYYVIDHGRRLCLFRAEPSEGLRETRLPGTSLPLDDTAISHVLRYWGLGEALYDEAPALPLFTSGARDQHTAAFATPVFGSGDKFMAALTLSGAASRLEAARTSSDVVALQLQAASDLSRKLGASAALCERIYGR
ncbi:helix-turn-helix domain-containing protein [Ralstonia insidiosa]|uniref:IclR family transcriptional regulator n=1 Tax=Ralstonia insidiosa TaxID=190721 RepID=A0A192A6L3_9RALS|nr:helix-turn-helix domain-containing protein [Ralstonia insidiosa]ANJ75978.1 IclR family transcriptional regulator [Ralstonia insidiosa]KAB0469218.1 helix-turn-helix domain-containing protein [Ralstonia insidiosa]MBY4909884.1 helix-turn-helix domain-containing protein [Ralstonia insidiosa]